MGPFESNSMTRPGQSSFVYESSGACVGCAVTMACPYFPEARGMSADFGLPCSPQEAWHEGGTSYPSGGPEAPFAVRFHERNGQPFAERLFCKGDRSQCRVAERSLFGDAKPKGR